MIEATLVLPQVLADQLAAAAALPNESGAVMIVGVTRGSDGLRLLGRELHWVPNSSYSGRSAESLDVMSSGYVPALARAADLGSAAIWIHTHPGVGSMPIPSPHDDIVDTELLEPFMVRTGTDMYASLIVSEATTLFRFSGRGFDGPTPFIIRRVVVLGDRLRVIGDVSASARDLPLAFDRQVRAFGGDVQRVLAVLHATVVGCGGTGSAVAEQLVRLGVRKLTLVDDDMLSASNITRVFGSRMELVGQPKVDVLANHLEQIAPGVTVMRVRGKVTTEDHARAISSSDVLVGCTDDNAGRVVLGRLAAYCLIPLIDCGVLISSAGGSLQSIDGRVTVQMPGDACLVCRNRVDLARAAAEQLDPMERAQRQDEGYAPELGRIEPAVIAFTAAVASAAVTELLDLLIGFGPDDGSNELLIRFHDREVSTNVGLPRAGHYCDPAAGSLGAGTAEPFLGTMWPRP